MRRRLTILIDVDEQKLAASPSILEPDPAEWSLADVADAYAEGVIRDGEVLTNEEA